MSESNEPSSQNSSPQPKKKKLLRAVIFTFVLFGIAEAGWRYYAWGEYQEKLEEYKQGLFDDDPLVGYRYKKGPHTIEVEGEDAVKFHINEWGLRGPEIGKEKPKNIFRILCLGGSTTFGTHCKRDEDTYPSVLQKLLQEAFPKVKFEVLNAGVPGYRTAESYQNLNRLQNLKPNMVLVLHAINDLCKGLEEPYYLDPISNPPPESRLKKREREFNSFFVEALLHRSFNSKPRIPKYRESISTKVLQAFRTNLINIAQLAKKIGAEPVFISFESRANAQTSKEVQEEITNEDMFRFTHMNFSNLVHYLKIFNDEIKLLGKQNELKIIELRNRLPKDKKIWPDYIHLSGEGTLLKSKVIFDQLQPIIKNMISVPSDE